MAKKIRFIAVLSFERSLMENRKVMFFCTESRLHVSAVGQSKDWTIHVQKDSEKIGALVLVKRGEGSPCIMVLQHLLFPTGKELKVHTIFCRAASVERPFHIEEGSFQSAVQKYLREHSQNWGELRKAFEQFGLRSPQTQHVTVHELNRLLRVLPGTSEKVMVSVEQQQSQMNQIPITTTSATASLSPLSVYLEERRGSVFLVVGEYSIHLRTENEFHSLCLRDRSNTLFCGHVTIKVGEQYFRVSCREIAETIQKASFGKEEVKKAFERSVEQIFGISKSQVSPINFPLENSELENALENSWVTDAKKVIQYIHENCSVLLDAVSWASPEVPCIRVKKKEELPCSFAFRVVDSTVLIEFATCLLGKGTFSTVRRIVLYWNNESGNPCVGAVACRRIRTKDEAGAHLSEEAQRCRKEALEYSFIVAKNLRKVVPYIGAEELLFIPAQGGLKEKIYTEEGKDTLDVVFSSLIGVESLSQERYCHLYAVVLCMLKTLEAMHRIDYFHFDIKPSNILIMNDDSPRLIDFGITKYIPSRVQLPGSTHRVTPGYKEPQCYDRTIPVDGVAGVAIDTFSLGATMLKLFYPQIFPNRRFLHCQSSREEGKATGSLFDETCVDILDYQAALRHVAQSSSSDKAALCTAIAKMISIPRKERPVEKDIFDILMKEAPTAARQQFEEFEQRQ